MEFSKEYICNIYNTCISKQDFINKLNINTFKRSGQAIDSDILNYVSLIGITDRKDIFAKAFRDRYQERLETEYYKNPKYCLHCGNVVPYYKRNTNCCCTSCSRSIANKNRGRHSEETKTKISEKLKTNVVQQYITNDNKYKLISECIDLGLIENYKNVEYVDKYIKISSCKTHICPICGKVYKTYLKKDGRLTNYSACSDDCLKIKSGNIISQNVKTRIENGTFSGWKSRNILSYPEKFWTEVLNNNNITYETNYPFDKYFLDFYIEHNNRKIDLEIDGKQHKYKDRRLSDINRDEFITSNQIEVYRIDWNEINSDKGKAKMKQKIDDFLEFYNK